jgi:hypothetical protein
MTRNRQLATIAPAEPRPCSLPSRRQRRPAALQRVADALVAGTIDVAAAKVLVDLIQTQARLIEVGELEARLAELEQQARNVDFGGR